MHNCEYAENHRTALFKWVNCVVCGLCLNKAIIFFFWKRKKRYEKIRKTISSASSCPRWLISSLLGMWSALAVYLSVWRRTTRCPRPCPPCSSPSLTLSGRASGLPSYQGSCRFAHSRNVPSGRCACDRQVTVGRWSLLGTVVSAGSARWQGGALCGGWHLS